MALPGIDPGSSPTEEQRLLLATCLCEGRDEARAAFAAWQVGVDLELGLEELDAASQALVPLLYCRLRELGVEHPVVAAARPRYLYTRVRNGALLQRLAGVLARLEAHGIPTLVLKGAALLVDRSYADPGGRPMTDVDLLVPPERTSEAAELLRDAGGEGAIELHARLSLGGADDGDADRDVWSAARQISVAGVPARVLDPADQLLQLVVSGGSRGAAPSLRWIADVCLASRATAGELRWERLFQQARARGIGSLVRGALGYLHAQRWLELPTGVRCVLGETPASPAARPRTGDGPPAGAAPASPTSDAPMLVAICPTYRRPHCIPNVLAMWAAQDYPGPRHLLIVDDGQTFEAQSGEDWTLISLPERLPFVGAKFAYCVERASALSAGWIVLFEDDDVYLPGYLSAHAAVLAAGYDASMAARVLSNYPVGAGKSCTSDAVGRHHGAWALTIQAYERCGGYPPDRSEAFDYDLLARLRAVDVRIGDPWPAPETIQYLYRWFTASRNSSAFGADLFASQDENQAVKCNGPLRPSFDEETAIYYATFAASVSGP